MQFDIQGADRADAYRLLASVVVPRPLALVTTLDDTGVVNAAPFSFFNLMGSDPPVVVLGIGDRGPGVPKDSRANLTRAGEFVVNLVHEGLMDAMNVCAADFPPGVSELDAAGLTAAPSSAVRVPGVAESLARLECRLLQVVEAGGNRIVIGEVVHLHIRDEFVDPARRRVRAEAMRLVGRMHGGGWYARTSDLFESARPTYASWLAARQEGGGQPEAATPPLTPSIPNSILKQDHHVNGRDIG